MGNNCSGWKQNSFPGEENPLYNSCPVQELVPLYLLILRLILNHLGRYYQLRFNKCLLVHPNIFKTPKRGSLNRTGCNSFEVHPMFLIKLLNYSWQSTLSTSWLFHFRSMMMKTVYGPDWHTQARDLRNHVKSLEWFECRLTGKMYWLNVPQPKYT